MFLLIYCLYKKKKIFFSLHKVFNTIPVNNYSNKTNDRINPLTTYNYFNIPIINIVVAPAKLTYLNDFPFNDITDESLRTELTIHNSIHSGKNLSFPT